ncbi:MAG TPA: hypothetical protein VNT81_00405 [Vicinamibacterales bacterium]|nr:hypothetical protein [Vicinamibacterales bacterium]
MKTSRLITVAAVFVLAGTPAGAQFRRGLPPSATEISLFPVVPPAILLPAGSFHVEVENRSSAPERLVPRLAEAITTQMSRNDRMLAAADSNGQMRVVVTLTNWTHARRQGTRYVSELRQIGSQTVMDGDGNTKPEPVFDYGRNKPNVVDNVTANVRIEVRRGTDVLADETARVTYQSDRLVEEGAPTMAEIEDALIERAAQKSAALVTPAREPVKVLLARTDEVDRLNALAVNGWWAEWRAALQERPSHPVAKHDAFRLHNLAVAL